MEGGLFRRFRSRRSKKPLIRKNSCALDGGLVPATVPLSSELQERCSGDEDRGGTEIETPRILAGAILDCAEQRGKKESTEATGGAYKAGENTDALRESLRNELEDGAVAHAEHAHGKKEKRNLHVK